ncbi:MAG: sulfatase-like hydrolase/transferase [Victivallaceae bacterium]|nr:sulfatase-like hydrolase/transferase [Victivallaceae bacterium]
MSSSKTLPNILVVISDQHAFSKTGCYGDTVVRTPNMDRLAQEGIRFDAAYTASPVCVPARMSFMTGRKPSENKVMENFDILSSGIPTWANHLSKAGYETALIGRMHFDGPDQFHGFDYVHPDFVNWKDGKPVCQFVRTANIPIDCYWSERGSVECSGSGDSYVQYRDEVIIEAACEYLKEKSENQSAQPFALVSGFYMPHPPFFGRKDLFEYYLEKISVADENSSMPDYMKDYFRTLRHWWDPEPIEKERKKIATAAYYAMCEHADILLGRLMDALDRFKFNDNTLVVYCSDHGELLGQKGAWGKLFHYENSVRVPIIARLPGQIPKNSVCRNVCNLRDLAQTFCDIAGAETITQTDSRSLWALMQGENIPWENYTESEIIGIPIYEQEYSALSKMVRKDAWKLIFYEIEERLHYSLYNLDEDPNEEVDLINKPEYAQLIEELKTRLHSNWDWQRIKSESLKRREDRLLINEYWDEIKLPPLYKSPEGLDNDVNLHNTL